jgi:hypothetical protein
LLKAAAHRARLPARGDAPHDSVKTAANNKVDFSTIRAIFPLWDGFSARFNLISFHQPGFHPFSANWTQHKVDFSTIRAIFPL